jgi:hypothetical protein
MRVAAVHAGPLDASLFDGPSRPSILVERGVLSMPLL